MAESYTYVLMDTRKPGPFRYGRYKFEWEPFYVGKGVGSRYRKHLRIAALTNDTGPRSNKIRKIQREGFQIGCRIVREGMTDAAAMDLEVKLIAVIGRKDTDDGPLVNLTDGGDGHRGFIKSSSVKRKLAVSVAASWQARTDRARQASLANLRDQSWRNDPEHMADIRARTSATVRATHAAKSEKQIRIDKRRRLEGQRKYFDSRTDAQKEAASEARRRSWETRRANPNYENGRSK